MSTEYHGRPNVQVRAIAEKLGGRVTELRAGLCVTLGDSQCPTFSRIINTDDALRAFIRAAELALSEGQQERYGRQLVDWADPHASIRNDVELAQFWYRLATAPVEARLAALSKTLGVEG